MPNDAFYDAALELAKVHLHHAWDVFCDDPLLQWSERSGNVPKARAQVWVDALKQTLTHYEELERRLE